MNTPVRTNPFADEEIFNSIARYEEQSPGLGELLLSEIRSTLALMSEYPEIGEIVPRARVRGQARRIPLRRFRYFVVYRNLDDHIEIMALAHTSRKPHYWRSRFT